jgi:hypothetical protein
MSNFELSAVATDEESVAIAAVVADVLSREAEVLSAPPPRPRQSDWVRAWRPRVPHVHTNPGRAVDTAEPGEEE